MKQKHAGHVTTCTIIIIYSRERFYVCAYKLKSFYNSSLIAAYVRANHSEYWMGQCTHRTLVQLASTQFKALEQRKHKVYSRTLACHLHASRARALISSSKGSMDVTRVSARECQVKLELYRSYNNILRMIVRTKYVSMHILSPSYI